MEVFVFLLGAVAVYALLTHEDETKYRRFKETAEMNQRHHIERINTDKVSVLGGNGVVSYKGDVLDPSTTRPMLEMAAPYFRSRHMVPQNYHYKPSATSNGPEPVVPAPQQAEMKVPSFSQMYNDSMFKSNQILMGFDADDNQPVYVGYESLYSLAIGGKTRSGKTNTIRNILGQMMYMGGQFCVIDKHAGNEDSLTSSLLGLEDYMPLPFAKDDSAITAVIAYIITEGHRRQQTGEKGTPLMLVADEFTGLVSRSGVAREVTMAFEETAQEFAKYNIFLIAAGQIWTASKLGNTDMRDSFASAVVHRSKQQHARTLINDLDATRAAPKLPQGRCFFEPANGDLVQLQVPFAPLEQIQSVVGMKMGRNGGNYSSRSTSDTSQQQHDTSEKHTRSTPEAHQKHIRSTADTWTIDEANIVQLHRLGHTKRAIYLELFKGKGRMAESKAYALINQTLFKLGA